MAALGSLQIILEREPERRVKSRHVFDQVYKRHVRLAYLFIGLKQMEDCVFILLKPGVQKGISRSRPLNGLDLKHLEEQFTTIGRNILDVIMDPSKIALLVLLHYLHFICPWKQVSSGDEVKEEGAKTKHVSFDCIALPSQNFRCCVARGPTLLVQLLSRIS